LRTLDRDRIGSLQARQFGFSFTKIVFAIFAVLAG
jgi:hypothetical protein